ncbi:MAG: DMT family transporter [Beijerinckiaceae bacterium]
MDTTDIKREGAEPVRRGTGGLSRENLGLLFGFVGVLAFGGTLPATRAAVAELAPWLVTMGRAALAGLLAGMVLIALRRPLPARRHWRDVAIASVCLVIAFPGFIGLAMQTSTASHGGVVLGILPLATAFVGALMMGERPSRAFWFWGAVGASLVVAFALRKTGLALSAGDLWLFAAVVVTALGYVHSARLSQAMPGWEAISWQLVVMLPLTLPAMFWLAEFRLPTAGIRAWAGFAYVTLVSQYLGFFAWNAGLAMGGVARVSQTQLLQSFVTLGISAAVLGEQIDAVTGIFALGVIGAVLMGRRAGVAKPLPRA